MVFFRSGVKVSEVNLLSTIFDWTHSLGTSIRNSLIGRVEYFTINTLSIIGCCSNNSYIIVRRCCCTEVSIAIGPAYGSWINI